MRRLLRYIYLLVLTMTASASFATVGSLSKTESYSFGSENLQLTEVRAIAASTTPDATLEGTGSGSSFGGLPVFKTCTNTTTSFTFTNASTTKDSNTSYKINWGDATADFITSSWSSIAHTYSIGLWNLTYTVEGSDGSSITKSYIVFVGSTPTVILGKPAVTDICTQSSLTFPITGTRNNPSGTTYTVTFSDGSEPQVFSHPAPSEVTHLFIKSSCGTTGTTYPNAFSATVVAENPCGKYESVVAPIYVSSPPIADFSLPINESCLNNEMCITNSTTDGGIAGSTGCLDPKVVWSISPANGATLVSGVLGNDSSSTDQNRWKTGTNVICLKFALPGTYSITMKVGNKCGTDQIIKTVCIETPIIPQFSISTTVGCSSVDVTTTNSSIVTNSCKTPVYSWNVSYVSGFCGTSPAYTYTNSTNSSSVNPSFQFTNPGTYTIQLSITNSCGTNTSTQTVIVKKQPPAVTIDNIPDFCGSAVIVPNASVVDCAAAASPINYSWSFPGGTPTNSYTQNPGSITYSKPGKYTVSLNITNECGISVNATKTFTIDTVPALTNVSMAQTICSGHQTDPVILIADVPGTTFTWTATATDGITGYTTSGNTNTIPEQTISTSLNVMGTVTYAITPMLGGCPGTIRNYVIYVNPVATFTSQPVSSTVCQGGTATGLSVSFKNGASATYQWYVNSVDNNTSGSLITGATSASYDPPTTIQGTKYYYCVVIFPSAACSSITSNTANVMVSSVPGITTQPLSPQNLCIGGSVVTPLSVTYVGGIGAPTIQWYSNTTNSNTGGSPIYGATSSSYTPPAFTTIGTYYYYVVLTYTGSACNTVISDVARINVLSDPVINAQPLITQMACINSNPVNLSLIVSGGTGAYLYQWYSNTVKNTTTGSIIAGAVGATYKPVTSAIGTTYYYCVVSQNGGPGCQVTTETAEVIVIPEPLFTSQPVSTSVCLGGSLSPLSVSISGNFETPTYQWFSNSVDNTATGTLIQGATSANYTPASTTLGTLYYYCVVSLPSGTCSGITSNTAGITVNAVPVPSAQPTLSQSICIGGTIPTPLTISYSGGTGTPAYQWYSNTANSNVGGVLIAGATGSGYTPPVFTVLGSYYYYVVLTFSGSGCTSVTSDVATINVVNDPTIMAQPLTTQTVCQNVAATDLTVTATGGLGIYYYQWYSNTVNNTTSGTLIPAAIGASYKPSTTAVGTLYYYCVVTQTPGLGCNVTSSSAEVIVVPALSFKQQPVSNSVCLGGTPVNLFVDYQNGSGTPTYKWFSNTVDNTGTGTPISGTNSSTYIPSTATVGTTYYYCTITMSSGTCTSITSNTAIFTVTADPVIATQPTTTQNICVGGTIKTPLNVQHLGGTGNISYQWYSNTSNSKVGGTPILNATASSYTPPVFTTTGSYYYYVELDFSASGCDKLTSNTAEIVVLADPIVTAAPTPTQTVCQNSAPTDLTFTVSGGDGVFSYQWYNNADNNTTTGTLITSATNAIYTPSTSTAGKIYYYCKITQSSAGCDATTPTAEVIVEPQPIFTTQPISNTVCQNTMPAALSVTYSGGVGTPSYQWYSNTINSTSGTIIQGATNPTYSPPTGKTGSLYYYCTISLSKGGCSSLTSGTAQFIVNAIPKIGTLNTTICSGDPFLVTPNNLTGDTVPVGTTYIWSYPVISPAGSITGASVQSIPQTSISQTLTNSSGSLATATYTVTPISGTACTGTGFNVVVTVNPAINIAATVTDITCLGANNGSIQTVISSGVPFGSGNPYAILWSGPNGFTSTATTISGLLAGVYNLTVSDAVGCSVSKNYTIVEPKAIVITTDNEKNIPCFGANNGEIGITITGGTPPYNFVWTKNTAFYSNTEDLSDLGPGVYELTVTDKFNCAPKKATFTISEPSVLDVSLASQTNVLCYGQASGAIAVNVTGGTPFEKTPGVFSYNYMWLGPNGFTSSNQNLSNLAEGKYDLVVTDFLGCSKTLSVTVTQSTEIVDNITTTPITCYNANNATISLVISGGNAPYQINWSNGGSGTFQGNLAAGTYIITVTDNLGCQNISHVNIAEAPVYSISPKVTNISCHGAHDGVINLNLIGGKTPISVVWGDDPTTATVRTNLAPGTYTVTINDGTPCNINDSYNILEPGELVLSANLTNATDCNGVNSGAIDLLVAGGTAPYTYLWSTGDKTEDIKNVPAGIYSVLVKDANGCSTTAEYTLTRPLPIDISVNQLDGYDCSIQKTIKTCVATVKEGVPPYKLSWSRGTTSGLNNETMVTTESGLVDLQVVDALGCSKSFSFNVDILKLGIDYIVSDCNARKYEFNALVLDNQESYTYAWDFGDGITSDLKNPHHTFGKPGNFDLKLTVTSASCVAVYTETITVESRPVLALDREPLLCIGDSVVLHATGANFYRWSDGTVADSITIREKGNFSVIGRTLAGCLDTLNFSTSYYDSFNYTISTDRNEVFTDGTPLHIWSEAIPYSSYTWYFGDSISDATAGSDVYHTYEPKQAGHYDIKLKVINPNGCTETATKRVWITNNSIINTFSPNGDGVNDVFMKGWHLKIFNRNGIAIFEGSDGWDGTNNGKTVSSDTYFFIVYYETESGSKTRTGYVTVIQ